MEDRFLEDIVSNCLRMGCSEAEASVRTGVSARVGPEQTIRIKEQVSHTHLSVRVLRDGKLGSASGSAINSTSAEVLSEMAVRSALSNPVLHYPPQIYTDNALPEKGNSITKEALPLDTWIDWIENEALLIGQTFDCQLHSLLFGYEAWGVTFFNSKGIIGRYQADRSMVTGLTQPDPRYSRQPTFLMCHGVMPGTNLVNILAEDHFTARLWCSTARSVENLKGRVRFSPIAAAQLLSLMAQAFNGQNILHRRSFLRQEQFNKQVGNPALSIVDDPVAPGSAAQIPFDAEGVLAKRKYLIKKGVFVNALCDTSTWAVIGFGSPGNAHLVPPNFETRITPSNLMIEPSGQDAEEDYAHYVEYLGGQSLIDMGTGILSGVATGYSVTASKKIPMMFRLGLDVDAIFAGMKPTSTPEWVGSVCVPALDFIIK